MYLTINRYFPIPVILLLCSLVLTSCLDDSDSTQTVGNLLEEAEAVNEFSTFLDYLDESAVDTSTLTQDSPQLTVMIPTNEAFSDLPDGTLDSLSNEELSEVMSYHLVEELIDLNTIDESADYESLQGEDLYFVVVPNNQGNASLYINGSNYLGGRQATNGLIYATDKVLFPDSYLDVTGLISKRIQLNELAEAIDDSNLSGTLEDTSSEFTIFAPSDGALDETDLTANDIEYHILEQKLLSSELSSQTYTTMNGQELTVDANGGTIRINGEATVTTSDIEGTNGVVHIIDTVLETPSE